MVYEQLGVLLLWVCVLGFVKSCFCLKKCLYPRMYLVSFTVCEASWRCTYSTLGTGNINQCLAYIRLRKSAQEMKTAD